MDKALDPVIEAPLVYPGEAESAKGYAVRAETAADRAEAVVGGLDSLQGLVDAAAASAKAAKDSADGATASATSAGQSAKNAARAMQGAGDNATSAKGDAEKSAASAAAAASSATAAAGSATAAAGYAKTASDAATGATDAKAAAVAAQKDAAASKAAAANSAAAAKSSEDAAAKSAADADRTANSINDSMTQIAANKEAVSQLKEDTAALQKRQNVLVGSETGNPIAVDDAFAAPLCGLTVYGKSTQDGTPSPDSPVPIVSAGDGGSVAVRVTGKNLFYEQEFQNYFINFEENAVGLSVGNVSSVLQVVTGAKYYVTRNKIGTKFRVAVVDKLPIQGSTVRPSSVIKADSKRQIEISATSKYMVIQCENEAGFNELMVSLDSSTTYSPYREQLLTLPTPNGLPGIPVTSGGNYTDQNGQQWVCDEVDFERSILIRRIYSEIYTGAERWQQNNSGIFLALSEAARDALKGTVISNIAVPCGSHPELSDSKPVGLRPTASGQSIGFFFVNNAQPTLDDWKTALSKTNAHVQYVLKKPIESKLTDAELAAYKALTTYAPDTVVQASDGAGIKLDYQRDVNFVVKNLEDAIASMTTT